MSKKEKLFIFLGLMIAFFLRMLWIFQLDNSVDVWGDWWDEIASNLIAGRGYFVANPFNPEGFPYYSWRPPAFPLFLAGIYAVFGHSFLYAKIGLAVISSVSVLLGYFVAARLFNHLTGRLTAIAMAVYPTFIFFTGYLAPETLTLFLILLTVFFLTMNIHNLRMNHSLLAGLSLGCAVMCRTIMALFFVFILIWLILMHKSRKDVWKYFLIMLAGMCIIISPWVARNYRIHKTLVFHSTDAGQALFINNNPESFNEPRGFSYSYNVQDFKNMSEIENSRLLSSKGMNFIMENPLTFMKYVGRRFVNFWRPFPRTISGPGQSYSKIHQILSGVYTIPVFIFALLGIFYSAENWRKLFLLYALVFYYSGTYILVRATIRYRMPIEPYLIMFAAYGILVFFRTGYKRLKNQDRVL